MSLNNRIEKLEASLEQDRKSEGIWVRYVDPLDGRPSTAWRNSQTGEIREDPPTDDVRLNVVYDTPLEEN